MRSPKSIDRLVKKAKKLQSVLSKVTSEAAKGVDEAFRRGEISPKEALNLVKEGTCSHPALIALREECQQQLEQEAIDGYGKSLDDLSDSETVSLVLDGIKRRSRQSQAYRKVLDALKN